MSTTRQEQVGRLCAAGQSVKAVAAKLGLSEHTVRAYYARHRRKKDGKHSVDLNPREKQVLLLIGDGLTTQEIADKLDLAYETIKAYTARIRDKLAIRRKPQLAVWAQQNRKLLGHASIVPRMRRVS